MRSILESLILALLVWIPVRAAGTNSFRSAQEALPGAVTEKLPLKFAVPSEFVVRDADDELKGLEGAGILWGSPETVQRARDTKKLSDLPGPLFLIRISDSVAQEGRNKFSVESDLKTALPLEGLSTKKISWAQYPVLHFTGIRKNGTVASGAWLGLNSPDGWTVFFDFRGRSKDKKLLPEDQKLWDAILKTATQ
jgi:hypothetical protein